MPPSTRPSTDFAALAREHLDAAYNLARWMTRDPSVAQDVVQDAMVRALKYFDSHRGDNGRAWLLQIVRNVALDTLAKSHPTVSLETMDVTDSPDRALVEFSNPEETMDRDAEQQRIAACVEQLPLELRECLVLREWEDLSYKEIARVLEAPVGTVMSRLWRARQLLAAALCKLPEYQQ
jgi:RNA polymerase sigma-70 factor (ECF subfamily)